MRIVKAGISFEKEILPCYERENSGWPGFAVGLDYLKEANTRCQGRWTLVLLSGTDIVSVMLPWHRHPIDVIPRAVVWALAHGLRNQAISLKFRLLSIQFKSEGFETGRKMSAMGIYQYLSACGALPKVETLQRTHFLRERKRGVAKTYLLG